MLEIPLEATMTVEEIKTLTNTQGTDWNRTPLTRSITLIYTATGQNVTAIEVGERGQWHDMVLVKTSGCLVWKHAGELSILRS